MQLKHKAVFACSLQETYYEIFVDSGRECPEKLNMTSAINASSDSLFPRRAVMIYCEAKEHLMCVYIDSVMHVHSVERYRNSQTTQYNFEETFNICDYYLFPRITSRYCIHMEFAEHVSNTVFLDVLYRPYPRDIYVVS